jgi:hypothetical protein
MIEKLISYLKVSSTKRMSDSILIVLKYIYKDNNFLI